jgi:hypothetical protein
VGAGHAVLHLDRDSPVHRLAPEVKILAVLLFTVVVVLTPRAGFAAFALRLPRRQRRPARRRPDRRRRRTGRPARPERRRQAEILKAIHIRVARCGGCMLRAGVDRL